MQTLYGHSSGVLVSLLVLVASWGSVFAILPGLFTHSPTPPRPTDTSSISSHACTPPVSFHRPHCSVMGGLSVVACLVSLSDLISVLIVVQTMTQFAAQCVAVMLLRRRGIAAPGSFRMPLYPLPALIALLVGSTSSSAARVCTSPSVPSCAATGAAAYLLLARHKKEWPFQVHDEVRSSHSW